MSELNNKIPKCIYCRKTYISNQINKEESKEPTMITGVNIQKKNNEFYYFFEECSHYICIYCISRLIFTNDLNILPSSSNITLICKCNEGKLSLNINQVHKITIIR